MKSKVGFYSFWLLLLRFEREEENHQEQRNESRMKLWFILWLLNATSVQLKSGNIESGSALVKILTRNRRGKDLTCSPS